MLGKVDLSKYANPEYDPGAGMMKRWLWLCCLEWIFRPYWVTPYKLKVFLLRLFGAKVGIGVYIKPNVLIKAPWKLMIGDFTWIGEGVWIDNVAHVEIGKHCCLSQGALIETGNHDYKDPNFGLLHQKVVIEDGVWLGAKSIVCSGVHVYAHGILSAGSVATKNIEAYGVYQGNPAVWKRNREIRT